MARIFYCLSGEGMGHATRSEVTIGHLSEKHEIVIFTYERAFDYLTKAFQGKKNILEIVQIIGFNFIYEKNEFKFGKTLMQEYRKIPPFFTENIQIYAKKILKYSPNLVITDFEPAAATFAKLLKIPLICIDNQGLFTKCEIDRQFRNNPWVRFAETLAFNGNFNFIISIFDIPIKRRFRQNTYMIGPIVRRQLLETPTSHGDHFLVYQTSKSNDDMFEILKSREEKFIIYGFGIQKTERNLVFKTPDVEGFAKDLASCKGVLTNGGFSLMCESVYLKKPVYSVPVKNQVEQEINGFYLKNKGFGHSSNVINRLDLDIFISRIQEYRANLATASFNVNEFGLLDQKVSVLSENYIPPEKKKMLKRIIKIRTDAKKRLRTIKKINDMLKEFTETARKRIRKLEKTLRKRGF